MISLVLPHRSSNWSKVVCSYRKPRFNERPCLWNVLLFCSWL